MPEIGRFFGVVISMRFNDHPPPHFHAAYGEWRISLRLADGDVIGRFPRRQLQQVLAWYDLHREELVEDWERARAGLPLARIEPLG